ncbi:hypothetical protein RR46_07478 [Papilio xuthus]|uniref:Uncharacterized protein n=1 Tax=Papilio xuthus TaxID=66420 RepID=A0A194Q5K9_PAPXU|nr:hypothetical protein RR46_07478 [Papilio xuthus]
MGEWGVLVSGRRCGRTVPDEGQRVYRGRRGMQHRRGTELLKTIAASPRHRLTPSTSLYDTCFWSCASVGRPLGYALGLYRERPSCAARRQPPRPPLHLGLQHRPGLPTTSLNDARLAPFDTVLRAQP